MEKTVFWGGDDDDAAKIRAVKSGRACELFSRSEVASPSLLLFLLFCRAIKTSVCLLSPRESGAIWRRRRRMDCAHFPHTMKRMELVLLFDRTSTCCALGGGEEDRTRFRPNNLTASRPTGLACVCGTPFLPENVGNAQIGNEHENAMVECREGETKREHSKFDREELMRVRGAFGET